MTIGDWLGVLMGVALIAGLIRLLFWLQKPVDRSPSSPRALAKLSRLPFGLDLATRVADCLAQGAVMAIAHRDYCGHGLVLRDKAYRVVEVHDGNPTDAVIAQWHGRDVFIDFLATQSDFSLSGADPESPLFKAVHRSGLNNQRITKRRLMEFVNAVPPTRMDLSVAREQVAHQVSVVDDVLNRYVQKHGCPCDWPQFEYWVSKPQGPGWQDNIQNDLVQASLKLPCFHRSPSPGQYGVDFSITCSNCGRKWLCYFEEWRMLAYHRRLVPMKPSPAANAFDGAVGGSIFATAGLEPKNVRALSLGDWAEFMLGELHQPPSA